MNAAAVRAREATGELLTAVLGQADLTPAQVQAVVAKLAPAGRKVTVERLAEVLDQLGFGLLLGAKPHRSDEDTLDGQTPLL